MSVELVVHPAAAWPDRVAEELVARLRGRPDVRLCLPTGDTPAPLYAALVRRLRRGEGSLRAATVVLLDEYVGLRPDDPAACDGRLRRELLDHVEGPAAYHAVRVDELGPEAAARAHDAVAADGIDLALLGLGRNGHVGLNEPGSSADSPTRVVALTEASRHAAVAGYGAERSPEAGVTLGLARLLAAGELWLLVTGEHKAEVLARALTGPESPDVPASLLRRHPRLRVLADEAAAAALPEVATAHGRGDPSSV